MRAHYFTLLVIILMGFVACKSDPIPVSTTSADYVNRRLVVEVKHVYDRVNRLDSMLAKATVKLFDEPIDRDEDEDVVRILTTNETGTATFGYMKTQVYYIRVEHPDFEPIDAQFDYKEGFVTAYEYYDFY